MKTEDYEAMCAILSAVYDDKEVVVHRERGKIIVFEQKRKIVYRPKDNTAHSNRDA